jgi:hypothetical protein
MGSEDGTGDDRIGMGHTERWASWWEVELWLLSLVPVWFEMSFAPVEKWEDVGK